MRLMMQNVSNLKLTLNTLWVIISRKKGYSPHIIILLINSSFLCHFLPGFYRKIARTVHYKKKNNETSSSLSITPVNRDQNFNMRLDCTHHSKQQKRAIMIMIEKFCTHKNSMEKVTTKFSLFNQNPNIHLFIIQIIILVHLKWCCLINLNMIFINAIRFN